MDRHKTLAEPPRSVTAQSLNPNIRRTDSSRSQYCRARSTRPGASCLLTSICTVAYYIEVSAHSISPACANGSNGAPFPHSLVHPPLFRRRFLQRNAVDLNDAVVLLDTSDILSPAPFHHTHYLDVVVQNNFLSFKTVLISWHLRRNNTLIRTSCIRVDNSTSGKRGALLPLPPF